MTLARLPAGAEIVAAFDADEAGRLLVEAIGLVVAKVAAKSGKTGLVFQVNLPAQEGEDWNQVLQRENWTCQNTSQ